MRSRWASIVLIALACALFVGACSGGSVSQGDALDKTDQISKANAAADANSGE